VNLPGLHPGARTSALSLFTGTTSTPLKDFNTLYNGSSSDDTTNKIPLCFTYFLPLLLPFPALIFFSENSSIRDFRPKVFTNFLKSFAFWISSMLESMIKGREYIDNPIKELYIQDQFAEYGKSRLTSAADDVTDVGWAWYRTEYFRSLMENAESEAGTNSAPAMAKGIV